MAWRCRDGEELELTGATHFDVAKIRQLVTQLRESRNNPQTVCRQIEECLTTRRAQRKLVWRLSKWCDWPDSSERIAREIANQLFYGEICRRLVDQKNKPIPTRRAAESDYQAWMQRVVAAGNPPSL
jgi:hypothetical protein